MSNTKPKPEKRPARSHLAPFLESPRPWLVLARNMVPVLGISLLGWSPDVIAFEIWFDGAAGLGMMLAFQTRAFDLHDPDHYGAPPGLPPWLRSLWLALPWLLVFLIVGIPYWFTLLVLDNFVLQDGIFALFRDTPGILIALLLVLVSKMLEEYQRNYDLKDDDQIRLDFNWAFNMHLARIVAMLFLLFWIRTGLIIILALALSYIEIYPLRALHVLGGDTYLDAENENRSRD